MTTRKRTSGSVSPSLIRIIIAGLLIVAGLAYLGMRETGDDQRSFFSRLLDADASEGDGSTTDYTVDGATPLAIDDSDGDGIPDDEDPYIDTNREPAESLEVRILWWNDTEDRSPEGFEVGFLGEDTWAPDIALEEDSMALGPMPVSESATLVVYPQGPGGPRFEVPVTFDSNMLSDSERDAIHVAVSDTVVRVLGNPVDEFDMRFEY